MADRGMAGIFQALASRVGGTSIKERESAIPMVWRNDKIEDLVGKRHEGLLEKKSVSTSLRAADTVRYTRLSLCSLTPSVPSQTAFHHAGNRVFVGQASWCTLCSGPVHCALAVQGGRVKAIQAH